MARKSRLPTPVICFRRAIFTHSGRFPQIVASGVSALKIEGRYKDAEYVALTTHAYRKAVDEAWAGREYFVTRAEELQLEQVYSRGLGPYFVTGTIIKKLWKAARRGIGAC